MDPPPFGRKRRRVEGPLLLLVFPPQCALSNSGTRQITIRHIKQDTNDNESNANDERGKSRLSETNMRSSPSRRRGWKPGDTGGALAKEGEGGGAGRDRRGDSHSRLDGGDEQRDNPPNGGRNDQKCLCRVTIRVLHPQADWGACTGGWDAMGFFTSGTPQSFSSSPDVSLLSSIFRGHKSHTRLKLQAKALWWGVSE